MKLPATIHSRSIPIWEGRSEEPFILPCTPLNNQSDNQILIRVIENRNQQNQVESLSRTETLDAEELNKRMNELNHYILKIQRVLEE